MFRCISKITRTWASTSSISRINGCSPTSARPHASNVLLQTRSVSIIKTTISNADLYAQEADSVLSTIQERLEADDIDLEFDNEINFSGDVLNMKTEKGTWVLNKHNVTKQLWLSSPISGPSKYNYHVPANVSQDTASLSELRGGRWLSERDDSTSLYTLLTSEFSEVFEKPIEFDFKF